MSKIDDYRNLCGQVEDAMKRYHFWCETTEDAPRGYFLQGELTKLTKSGEFFVLLEKHFEKMLSKAREDAAVEAAEFMRQQL
jgi:hypothetical protein